MLKPSGLIIAIVELLDVMKRYMLMWRSYNVGPVPMAQGRHITTEQRRAIIETLEATHNASEAARLNAVSVSTAWKVAKEEGIVLQNRGRPPTISAEQRQAIIETLEATHNASGCPAYRSGCGDGTDNSQRRRY